MSKYEYSMASEDRHLQDDVCKLKFSLNFMYNLALFNDSMC